MRIKWYCFSEMPFLPQKIGIFESKFELKKKKLGKLSQYDIHAFRVVFHKNALLTKLEG